MLLQGLRLDIGFTEGASVGRCLRVTRAVGSELERLVESPTTRFAVELEDELVFSVYAKTQSIHAAVFLVTHD